MNWLKKLVVKWVREDNEKDHWEESVPRIRNGGLSKAAMVGGGGTLDSDATLTFTVYNAIGGKVVEFRRYDRKTDRSEHSVYVIGKDEDFGAKISKISTLECMK